MLAYLLRRFSLDDLPLSWDALAMSISPSSDLDDHIQQKVIRAGYRTPDEVIRKALDALDARSNMRVARSEGEENVCRSREAALLNAARSIPEEELAALPSDGARGWTTPALFGLDALVTLMAQALLQTESRVVRMAAGYGKTRPTFSDARAVVRRELWSRDHFSTSRAKPEVVAIPRSLVARLIAAVYYAA
jgi:Arc/MetJ-type ribon-helix-helix transcriptional regulator